jgi:hypothetical protein
MSPYSCACLALYGCDPRLTVPLWLDLAERYFEFVGVQPSYCVLTSAAGRTHNFKWSRARTRIAGVTEVDNVFGYVELPGSRDLLQWQAASSWVRPQHCALPTVFFGHRESVGAFSAADCAYLSRLTTERCAVAYGIGYEFDGRLGPEAYAHGMEVQYGDLELRESECRGIESWWREFSAPQEDEPRRLRHLAGMLRDVYPVAVLSPAHLAQEVGDISLGEWIAGAPGRGALTSVGASNQLWTLPKTDIAAVRAVLKTAGLIIADGGSTRAKLLSRPRAGHSGPPGTGLLTSQSPSSSEFAVGDDFG